MVMSLAQFTERAGLRDVETTLNLCGDLYRSGIKAMPRSTLAEANEKKGIKQHLHIKTFYGTFQNAVYTQIRIAVCDYLLLIIAKKRHGLVPSLHSISNSIGQVLFQGGADIRELYNQPTDPVSVPEASSVEQLNGKISPDSSEQ